MEIGERYEIWQSAADYTFVQQHRRKINGKVFGFTLVRDMKKKATSITVSELSLMIMQRRTLNFKKGN